MHISRRWLFAPTVLSVVLVASCSGTPAAPEREAPELTLSFTQSRCDEGTPRALLRVVNHEKRALTPTAIGLDWSGYGGRFRQSYDTTIAPGQTLDLRITLPPPDCADGSGGVRGFVEFGSTSVRQRLDPSGQGWVTRIWERACTEKYVADRTRLTYGDTWRRVGRGPSSSLLGSIRLSRRDSPQEIRILDVQGSVLFGLRLADPVALTPSSTAGSYSLRILPGRCDEHARSQSTTSFHFRVTVQFGDSRPVTAIVIPGPHTQTKALAMLDRACR